MAKAQLLVLPAARNTVMVVDDQSTGRAILEQVAQGRDNAQIAARLELSEKTIRNYLVAILDKLEVETRAQAIVRARDAGLGRASP